MFKLKIGVIKILVQTNHSDSWESRVKYVILPFPLVLTYLYKYLLALLGPLEAAFGFNSGLVTWALPKIIPQRPPQITFQLISHVFSLNLKLLFESLQYLKRYIEIKHSML